MPPNMCAMPSAKVGAPPVRPIILCSPTLAANCAICAGVTGKPSAVTCAVTAAAAPFILMAKYSPGCMTHAAISAMTPTSISVIMAP